MVVGVSGLDGHNALSSVERAYKLVTGHVTQHLTTVVPVSVYPLVLGDAMEVYVEVNKHMCSYRK